VFRWQIINAAISDPCCRGWREAYGGLHHGPTHQKKKAQKSQNFLSSFVPFCGLFSLHHATLVPVGLRLHAVVNRFHEHIGRPGAGIGAVTGVIIGRWPGAALTTAKVAPSLMRARMRPRDDHHHVAVLQYLMLIGEVAVARDNHGSTLSFVLIAGKAQDVIQRLDLALHAAAVR